MKNYAQALHYSINNIQQFTSCSTIPFNYAKSLYGQKIQIKEKDSGVVFEALVVDYCFEDQFGIIVKLRKSDSKLLKHKKKCRPSDSRPDLYVELDLRNTFEGHLFELVTQVH